MEDDQAGAHLLQPESRRHQEGFRAESISLTGIIPNLLSFIRPADLTIFDMNDSLIVNHLSCLFLRHLRRSWMAFGIVPDGDFCGFD